MGFSVAMKVLDVTGGKHLFIQTNSPIHTHPILITGAHAVLNIIYDDGEQITSLLESNIKIKQGRLKKGAQSKKGINVTAFSQQGRGSTNPPIIHTLVS